MAKKRITKKRVEMSNKKKFTALSIILTLCVISALVFSGPVNAVNVQIHNLPTSADSVSSITFTASVDIQSGERIPVKNLTVKLTNTAGQINYTCVFMVNGTSLNGCTGISIKSLTQNAINYSNGPMWGYGYGFDDSSGLTNYSNTTFFDGFGYGYVASYSNNTYPYGILSYNITLVTPNLNSDTLYSVSFSALVEDLAGKQRTYQTVTPAWITVNAASVSPTVPSDSSGSGSGGGTVVNIIKNENEYAHVWGEVIGGLNITVDNPKIPFTYVSFNLRNKSVDVHFTVDLLGSAPDFIPPLEFFAYKYMKVTAKNLDDANLYYTKLTFRVDDSWLANNSIDRKTILLYRYTQNHWEQLSTNFVNDDLSYSYFTASTQGFSYFAIVSSSSPGKVSQQLSPAKKNNPVIVQPTSTPSSGSSQNNASKLEKPLPTNLQGAADVPPNFTLILSSIIIILCVISICIYFIFQKQEDTKIDKLNSLEQSGMLKSINEYITVQLAKNIHAETIKKALISKGWAKEDVEKSFKAVRK